MASNSPQAGSAGNRALQDPTQAEQAGRITRFLRTTAGVLFHPRAFFARHFQNGARPPDQHKRASQPLGTFEYLGIAIGIAAAVAPLHRALLRAGDFPEHFLQLAEGGMAALVANYERTTGRNITLIDVTQLTGVAVIDAPIEDFARMVVYSLFAALFWMFSGGRLPLRRMVGYFAYAFGACVVVETIFLLLGDLLFVLLSDLPGQRGFFVASSIHQLGGIPRLIFLFVLPSVMLPAILHIRRRVVVIATVLAAMTWALVGMTLAFVMLAGGLVVNMPGF